ncbi:Magnesium transporter CorA-like family protein [Striga hermonthica]|uniref:Magnesium transporter CorA-like family protein n=1 Tax=Striga hermonthica TaxID=68872 RepID=A0A9N7R6Q9_STRHE|nr:Magnesium transporter CorA-like family protein [Striga hermonthica]
MTFEINSNPPTMSNVSKKPEKHKNQHSRDVTLDSELWTDGLICAFEFIRGNKIPLLKSRSTNNPSTSHFRKKNSNRILSLQTDLDYLNIDTADGNSHAQERSSGNVWVPIGWTRITKLLTTVKFVSVWASQPIEMDDEDDITVADVVAPFWERPVGPTWWCHVDASHPYVNSWLSDAQWLHPAISVALRDESKLISERMKHLLYEVPVRVAGGLLFELLGQSVGDPYAEEEDIPVVIRSWQAQNFLLTALHVKGSSSNINVLGCSEVQELLAAGGSNMPRTSHEVIALLACRLARWDDRLFRKYIFGEADEVELKFMNRRTQEDMHIFCIILNQEIRRLSTQVIRVKWCLHAREEIVFELLQHVRGFAARNLLEGLRKSTRQMIQEQEAVRARLFTIQDVMQSTVRAWLQDQSLHVQHNLGVFGGCGLVLSIITGLWGINVDGIPGSNRSPYAFALFTGALFLLGAVLIAIGLIYLGLKKPLIEEKAEVRKLELQELVKMFQQEAESHAQVRKMDSQSKTSSAAKDIFGDGENFVLIN